jgi:hypothetical protein
MPPAPTVLRVRPRPAGPSGRPRRRLPLDDTSGRADVTPPVADAEQPGLFRAHDPNTLCGRRIEATPGGIHPGDIVDVRPMV